jgi:hypothetical protein
MEKPISRESAQAEIERFCDYYMIITDDEEEESQTTKRFLAKLKNALRHGMIWFSDENTDNGQGFIVHQKLRHPIKSQDGSSEINQIDYGVFSGKHKCAVKDEEEDGLGTKRIHQFLASLSGEPASIFGSLKGPDHSIAEALGSIFLLL